MSAKKHKALRRACLKLATLWVPMERNRRTGAKQWPTGTFRRIYQDAKRAARA